MMQMCVWADKECIPHGRDNKSPRHQIKATQCCAHVLSIGSEGVVIAMYSVTVTAEDISHTAMCIGPASRLTLLIHTTHCINS